MLYKRIIEKNDYKILSGGTTTILNLIVVNEHNLSIQHLKNKEITKLRFSESSDIIKGTWITINLIQNIVTVPFCIREIEEVKPGKLYRLYAFSNTIWRYLLPWVATTATSIRDFPMYENYVESGLRSIDLNYKFDLKNPKIVAVYLVHVFEKKVTQQIQKLEKESKSNVRWLGDNYFVHQLPVVKLDQFQLLLDGKFSELANKEEIINFSKNTHIQNVLKQILFKDKNLKKDMERQLNANLDNMELHSPLQPDKMILNLSDFTPIDSQKLKPVSLKKAFDE